MREYLLITLGIYRNTDGIEGIIIEEELCNISVSIINYWN
jgi:hypothetical protein